MQLKKIKWLIFVIGLFTFSSCIEIIDDLTLHSNGSGTWRLKINLSESAVKINSILALDSLNGHEVPTKKALSQKAIHFESFLAKQPGIGQVHLEEDLTHYVWTISIQFNTLPELETAFVNTLKEQNIKGVELPKNGFVRKKGNTIVKQFPFDLSGLSNKIKAEDKAKLFEGKYISILRFDSIILKNTNLRYQISKNKKATMAMYSLKECLQNTTILSNQTTLK